MAKKGSKRDGSKSTAVRDYLKKNPGTGAKAVQEALAGDGIDVSIALINKIKYEKPSSGQATTARRGRPKASGELSASDHIRRYMDDHPDATRPEIRDALNAQGINVTTSLVNAVYVKYLEKQGKKPRTARGGRRATSQRAVAPKSSPSRGGELSATELINAKGLVDQLGGIDKVRQALALLEQLQ